jgi:hypothetical protein
MLADRSDQVHLSAEQFAKLVELLTPGYELSKIFLDQHKAAAAEPKPDQEPVKAHPDQEPADGKTLNDLAGKLG